MNYKELGFNKAELQFGKNTNYNEILGIIDDIGGIDVVIENKDVFTPSGNNFVLSENLIRKTVGNYAKYDCVIGYNIYDEIIPDENNAQYNRALSCIELLNKYSPNGLKFINLLPSYNSLYTWDNDTYDDYVSGFIDTFNPQVLSFDYYPYLMGTEESGSDWWRDLGLFRKESIEHNIPLWYYYQGYNISEDRPTPTNDEIKYQMYVGLAYGAKQLSEWLANYEALTPDGEKTENFEAAKARNAEIMTVGNFLFDKKSVAIYQTKDGLFNNPFSDTAKFYLDDISKSSLLNSASNGLILSVFEDENAKYLLVVNRNTEDSVSGTISLDNSMSISKLNKSAGTEEYVGNSNSISLNIAAGGGEVYILK